MAVYAPTKAEEYVPVEIKTKKKTKGGKQGGDNEESAEQSSTSEDNWSQAQQKALEAALTQFPKGASERWERISSKVPGKSKEQCIQRFKYLAEMVKKKKEEATNSCSTSDNNQVEEASA